MSVGLSNSEEGFNSICFRLSRPMFNRVSRCLLIDSALRYSLETFPSGPSRRSCLWVAETLERAVICASFCRSSWLSLSFFVKKYLRQNCDYTFETLKADMPFALRCFQNFPFKSSGDGNIACIDGWQHTVMVLHAQFKVRKFTSKYKSHAQKTLYTEAWRWPIMMPSVFIHLSFLQPKRAFL